MKPCKKIAPCKVLLRAKVSLHAKVPLQAKVTLCVKMTLCDILTGSPTNNHTNVRESKHYLAVTLKYVYMKYVFEMTCQHQKKINITTALKQVIEMTNSLF